jgi:hypothetical protein
MSEPNVFIIESLEFEDEEDERFEGEFLSRILHLAGKEPLYYYIRTAQELEIFGESRYRYLHISCHGTDTSLFMTLNRLSFSQFGRLVRPHLMQRRLFISACSSVNEKLAREIIPNSGCYSLIGPTIDVEFRDAAIMWASFYHLIFKENYRSMKRKDIYPVLKKVVNTFEVPVNYFFTNSTAKKGYRRRQIKPGNKRQVGNSTWN